jgi:hypothetical protein
MGKARRGALAGFGWVVWKAGSKIGWRYATNKMDQRKQTATSAERSAAAAERTADAAERTADAAERSGK